MTKAERILDFVHKIANKEHITYEQAERLAITKEFIKMVEGDNTLIFDGAQMILNQTVNEILDDNDYDDELPTNEEIDKVVEYFKMRDSENDYETYLQPLIEKHGEKWVDSVVYAVMSNILNGNTKGE